jgi:hypothetical protein
MVVRAPHRHNSKGENGQGKRDRMGWSRELCLGTSAKERMDWTGGTGKDGRKNTA